MKRVVFSKNLMLIKVVQSYGHSDTKDRTSLNVKGNVSLPSLRLRTSMEGVGRAIDLTAQIWRRDFEKDDFTHVEYDGTRYRIDNVSVSLNDLIVKLSLVRG